VLLSGFVLGAAAGYRKNLVAYQVMPSKKQLEIGHCANTTINTVYISHSRHGNNKLMRAMRL